MFGIALIAKRKGVIAMTRKQIALIKDCKGMEVK